MDEDAWIGSRPGPGSPGAEAATLASVLSSFAKPVFAVLDGGRFDDLPADLAAAGVAARSLFLEHADAEVEKAGPWLAEWQDGANGAFLISLALERPCAVFWSCPVGETVLWRHLRTLNRAIVPRESRAPEPGEGGPGEAPVPAGTETVLFRHWDPDVLAMLLPLLDEGQFARVLGPAAALALHAPDHGGLGRAYPMEGAPEPPRGMLRLTAGQMDGLRADMVAASRRRVAGFLKDNVPPGGSGVDAGFFHRVALHSEPSAKALGIETERGRARWAYLMMLSNGKAAQAPEVTAFLRQGASADEQVKALVGHTAQALRTGRTIAPVRQ